MIVLEIIRIIPLVGLITVFRIILLVGLITVCSVPIILIIWILESFKNRKLLKNIRIGDEIEGEESFSLIRGVVIHIDNTKKEVVLLCLGGGCLLRTVKPENFIKTGLRYSITELNELMEVEKWKN